MPDDSNFRLFVNNMYQAAMNERADWKSEPSTIQEYFDNNKFWLKSQFQSGKEIIDIVN